MQEITFSGTAQGIMFFLAIAFVMYILLGILMLVLEILTILRWKLNYDVLSHGKTPENPIKLSIIYQADFIKIKSKLPNGIVEIAGIELNLGFKECIKSLYVRFPENISSSLKPGLMYDFKMSPVWNEKL